MDTQEFATDRLVLKPANNGIDLATFKRELAPEEYWFQFGYEYDEHLLDGHDFTSLGVICYSAFRKSDGAYVGYVGIKPDDDEPEVGSLEYFVAKAYRNKGYCKEAAAALINAFQSDALTGTKGETVLATIDSENEVSARVLHSLGFHKESRSLTLRLIEDPDNPDDYSTVGAIDDHYILDLGAGHSLQRRSATPTFACEDLPTCA